MINFRNLVLISFLLLLFSCGKKEEFPVTYWDSGYYDSPVIFYMSGDAGFNTFSKKFAGELHSAGYDVFALDSKKYFWNKRTPEEVSKQVENFLKEITANRKNKNIILLGFSYGADVVPFVYNRFDGDFKKQIKKIVIVGPSKVNDFEIHLSEYITGSMQYGYSVLHEINNIKNANATVIVSDFEYKYFPWKKITLKPFNFLHLPGDHHYNNNTQMLASTVLKQLK